MVYINNLIEDEQIEIYNSLNDFSEEDILVFEEMK